MSNADLIARAHSWVCNNPTDPTDELITELAATLAAQDNIIEEQAQEIVGLRDELENTRYRETKLEESVSEIGARSRELETHRNNLRRDLENEMLRADKIIVALRE